MGEDRLRDVATAMHCDRLRNGAMNDDYSAPKKAYNFMLK